MANKETYSAKHITALSPRNHLIKRINLTFSQELGDESYPFSSQKSVAIREYLDNSVGELIRKFGDRMRIHFYKDGAISVQDNGRGLPTDTTKNAHGEEVSGFIITLGTLQSGEQLGKSDDDSKTTSTNGLGAAASTMLSKRVDITVYKNKKKYTLSFKDGDPGYFEGDGVDAKFTELKDLAQLGKAADLLQKSVQDFRLFMGGEGQIRGNLRELFVDKKVVDGLNKISEHIDFLSQIIKKSLGRSETLDKIFERLAEVKVLLKKMSETHVVGYCYWYEANGRSFGLHITPLTVADKFGEQLKNQKIAWVFTSATLEVGGKFDHFCQRLGIQEAEQMVLQSPFDYAKQSLLCVPRFLPDSNKAHTLTALGELLMPVIEANQGRCFLLCTSYYMMRGLADFLREHSQLNVLLQGETSKSKLLEKFIQEPHSVLVATQSFWEGIDVRGDDLSLVIIDKFIFFYIFFA